jgi:hypothetical protein
MRLLWEYVLNIVERTSVVWIWIDGFVRLDALRLKKDNTG